MEEEGNLGANLANYFELSFIMVEVGNLDAKLASYFMRSL
jgi:hypothetical protein